MDYVNPHFLVSTEWLAEHLDDENLVILDCSVYLHPTEDGVRPMSGYEDWQASHLSGSSYVDLLNELSDGDSPLPVMMPSVGQFAAAMSRYGVGMDSKVILYDSAEGTWAARVWWMLRSFGFDNAAVLNGGLKKWRAENRPVTDEATEVKPGDFTADPRRGLISNREAVQAAMGNEDIGLLNALTPEEFSGEICRVARPGRIPGSLNLPASSLINSKDNTFHQADKLDDLFREAGIYETNRHIAYCGAGIAASGLAFAMVLMGIDTVSVYDGSLVEWSSDPQLPLETG